MNIRLLFLYLYMLLDYFHAESKNNVDVLKTGPFKSIVTRSERCKRPLKPFEKNPGLLFYSDIYSSGNRTFMSGNLTVLRVNPRMKLQAKGFLQEDGKYKIIYMANSAGCSGLLVNVWKIALNAQQHEGCLPKGSYIFKDLDFNYIQHMWLKSFMYGSFMWRLTVLSNAGTTICWEFDCLTAPLP